MKTPYLNQKNKEAASKWTCIYTVFPFSQMSDTEIYNNDTTKENDQIQQKEFKYHKPRVDSETQAS